MPILGTGDAVRDWLYVDDAVEVLLVALDTHDRWVVAHAGTGRGTSVLALVDRIRKITEATCQVELFESQAGEPHTLLLDLADTRQRWSWQAGVDLRKGLLHTWSWLLARGG